MNLRVLVKYLGRRYEAAPVNNLRRQHSTHAFSLTGKQLPVVDVYGTGAGGTEAAGAGASIVGAGGVGAGGVGAGGVRASVIGVGAVCGVM